MGAAERVQRVDERDLLDALADAERVHLLERALLQHVIVGDGVERESSGINGCIR